MSAADKAKLNGVEANANNYSHPATHSLDVITETATKIFKNVPEALAHFEAEGMFAPGNLFGN
jgi:hypothetical protein